MIDLFSEKRFLRAPLCKPSCALRLSFRKNAQRHHRDSQSFLFQILSLHGINNLIPISCIINLICAPSPLERAGVRFFVLSRFLSGLDMAEVNFFICIPGFISRKVAKPLFFYSCYFVQFVVKVPQRFAEFFVLDFKFPWYQQF